MTTTASIGAGRRSSIGTVRPQAVLAAVVISSALVFGGGTRPGLPSDVIVGWVSGVSLIAVLPTYFTDADLKGARPYVAATLALLLVPLLQLIPLPPWIWSHLPGHTDEAAALRAAGMQLNWQPLSVSASLTSGAMLSLAAPIAAFLLVLQLTFSQRRMLMFGLLAFGVMSVALGFMQISQGENSPLRFYAVTNPSEAVGFFANRNHFGALLYMLVPLSAAVAITAGAEFSSSEGKGASARGAVLLAVAGGVFALILLAQGVVRSRAGLALTGLSTVASFFLLAAWHDRRSNWRSVRYLVAAAGIGLVLVANFALFRLLQRTTFDPVDPYRTAMNATTWQAAKAFLPFGSGVGTFVPVYFTVEHLGDLTSEYVNRAHDDYLESLLETGVVAPFAIAAFVGWWVWRAWTIWREPLPRLRMMDGLLARAATISLALPLIHSAFDYPLRTEALMVVFAILAAMLLPPFVPVGSEPEDLPRRARNRRRRRSRDAVQTPAFAPQPVRPVVRGLPPKRVTPDQKPPEAT